MPTTLHATITTNQDGISLEHLALYVRNVIHGDPDSIVDIPADVLDRLENQPPYSIPEPWDIQIHPGQFLFVPGEGHCVWVQDHADGGCWTPTCGGGTFCLEEDGPEANRMRYCCRCGRRIVEMPCEPDDWIPAEDDA